MPRRGISCGRSPKADLSPECVGIHPGLSGCPMAYSITARGQFVAHMEKSTRWAFTAYENQWELFNRPVTDPIAKWGWQEEVCPDSGRRHYQGYIQTTRQVRLSQLVKILPGVHLEIARNWDALVNYCKKDETAVDGTRFEATNPVRSMSMAQALIRVASKVKPVFTGADSDLDQIRKRNALEFDVAVAELLREDENLIGLYSQPQYERAYVKWRNVWLEKANSEKTDRQTDIDEELEDSVNFEIHSRNYDTDEDENKKLPKGRFLGE